ncbi:hypothetical protein NE237_016137 [Protea cynaroides]|uniref:non-specific serine/threonine protein kinase n=1 Tax=Protea cynaroides TaxID=273540 RepID=A0A9Q0KFK8_9MAGN|nr:hypothetical protein NE237_016137 [Protea cynaroides]
MLYGRTPFKGANRKETFYRILVKSPELVGEPTALRDLIGKLLEKDPTKRISMEEIKGHDYFRGVDWESILEIARPPFIPLLHEEDMKEIKSIDLELFVQGIFDDEVVGNIKGSGNFDQNEKKREEVNKGVLVETLKNPSKSADFSVF